VRWTIAAVLLETLAFKVAWRSWLDAGLGLAVGAALAVVLLLATRRRPPPPAPTPS
jgi:hypothetical protein